MKTLQCSFLIICLLSFQFYVNISQDSAGNEGSSPGNMTDCTGASTCGECVQRGHLCAWCETIDFSNNGVSRCNTEEKLLRLDCLKYTMPLTEATIVEDRELTNAQESENVIQIQPQRVRLKIRNNDTHSIRVKVRHAEDYPVDLYYLMDVSRSRGRDLETIKSLGTRIGDALNQITSDGRLGFGAFVDKTVLPYVSTVPGEMTEMCRECELPYSFRNVLALDSNTSLFAQSVNETRLSLNKDLPEGSLDALMQATVCKDEIGWRERARRLILYTSDAWFHIAGDGRLGGIVTPNDGNCHLDNQGEYADANVYDYPSIGQLNAKMRENKIIPIFAVTENTFELYQNLSELIDGSVVDTLEDASRNFVDIIQLNYLKVTGKIQLVDTAPAGLELSYSSRCTVDGDFEEGSTCTGLHLGETVEFDVAVRTTDCLVASNNVSFQIQPIGFDEALTVDVEVICECDCENIELLDGDVCNGNGSLICGECMCNEGRYGENCECSIADLEKEADCLPGSATNVCFGRGECVCGECVCNIRPDPREVISGTYCQCDNFSCPRDRGELCGGPERGECVCDKVTSHSACKCRPGFQGMACDCPTSQDSCRANNGLICNGVGNCTCGECQCDTYSIFQGQRCDQCATCNEDQCFFHQACFQCKVFNSGVLTKEQCEMCLVEIIAVQSLAYLEDVTNCSLVGDADNCSINFAYRMKSNPLNTIIYYEKNPVCARSTMTRLTQDQNFLVLVGIVLGIVVIGIVIAVIYRLWTYIQDRRRYAQWMKDQQKTNSEQNTFKNPTYCKLN